MRIITDHVLNGLNENLALEAGPAGNGGASHDYVIRLGNTSRDAKVSAYPLHFQEGAIGEIGGVNGISNEVLVAIVIDRLRGFQEGPFKCRENAIALTKIEESLMWMQSRTRRRMQQGTEGTHAGN